MESDTYDFYAQPQNQDHVVTKHKIGHLFYYFKHVNRHTQEVVRFGKSKTPKDFLPQQVQLVRRLCKKFYTKKILRHLVVPLITKTTTISLRCVDWLVTNYCETQRVVYKTQKGDVIELRQLYESWLDRFGKKNLDSYRRHWRLLFHCDNLVYSTTPAQLNFLHLCSVYGVLDYCKKYKKDIEGDLVAHQQRHRKPKRRRTHPRSPTYYPMEYMYQSITNIVMSDDGEDTE
tara:strand:+ start:15175 stop:15867 length:693 start_codon:yes stop_codon:yes gene_type:complete